LFYLVNLVKDFKGQLLIYKKYVMRHFFKIQKVLGSPPTRAINFLLGRIPRIEGVFFSQIDGKLTEN